MQRERGSSALQSRECREHPFPKLYISLLLLLCLLLHNLLHFFHRVMLQNSG
jgi:hypothetical protein